MQKILIVNEVCSDNIGDHAINEGIRKVVSDAGYIAESIGFDAGKKNVKSQPVKKNTKVSFIRRVRHYIFWKNQFVKYTRWYINNIKRIRNVFVDNYGAMIVGGGQLIQSGGTFPIAMYIWSREAKKNKIPFYIVGVGCAEKFTKIDKWLYKKAFSYSSGFFVREKKSIEKIESFFSVKPGYIPDLAYALYDEHSTIEIKKKNISIIGATAYYVHKKNIDEINAVDEGDFESYVSYWINIIEKEIQTGNVVQLVSTTVEDADLNKFIYDKIICDENKNYINLIENVPSLNEYLNHLKDAKVVYSGRMHTLILGHINNCQLSPAILSKKIEYYMHEYSSLSAMDLKRKVYETVQVNLLQ